MKLTKQNIEAIAIGVAYIEEENDLISLHRFTKAQEELYKPRSEDAYKKTFATAGIRLMFTTDSPWLYLETEVSSGSSRKFFSHEIFANGILVGDLSCSTENNGIFSKRFDLGAGEKTICIYFPWSACSKIRAMELENGATLIPQRPTKRMLIYGDSITHGYDAISPSKSYASLLADALHADARNKGIGGAVFWKRLAQTDEGFVPDYITVAYGTNDWSGRTPEDFEDHCAGFYHSLSQRYPTAKIFAITPIWRADQERITKLGEFSRASEYIHEITRDLPNVTVIDGIDLVPHETDLFSDRYLHPNDEGFAHYFNNLFAEIQKYL